MDSVAFERDGFALVRRALDDSSVKILQAGWAIFSQTGREVKYNPVAVEGPFNPTLDLLPKHPELLRIVEAAFGPDIALYNYRFVVKDKHARGEVFPHQDTGYHVGFPRKASLFVALSECDSQNGGMKFYTGTHKYGYLGDAGEIAQQLLEGRSWSCPFLEPGDAVLMHSALWHASFAHISGPDRVLADIIYQPADDPSGKELLRGEWRCTPEPWLRTEGIFKRSRASRLKDLQEQNDRLMEAVGGKG